MRENIRRPRPFLLLILVTALTLPAVEPAWAQADPSPPAATRTQSPVALKLLADRGNRTAQFLLGGLYARGEGVPQDDEMAADLWRKSAEQGMADAQNEFAAALAEGRGVRQNTKQAVEWYRKAAEQGLAVAQASLGTMYLDGTGVGKDEKQAVEWFQKSAAQGLAWAQLFLGDAYASGRGVTKDLKQAAAWYRKSAQQDYADAQYALGALYRKNRASVVPRGDNSREAYGEYWLTRAAQQEHEQAEKDLQRIVASSSKQIKLAAGVAIRERPDATAAIIRNAGKGEPAYVLPEPDGRGHLKDWVAVYLEEGNTMGFVSEADSAK